MGRGSARSGRNFLVGRRVSLGRGRNFPAEKRGTLPREGLCQERKEILDREKGITWGGSPLGAKGTSCGEKGRSPGEGSFPKEICPQGKGEAIAGDALRS